MKISLYQKLAFSLFIIFSLICTLVLSWSQQLDHISQNQAEQKLHLNLAEHLVQDNPLLQQGVYDHQALENLFHTLMLLGPAFEFYFVDPSGEILTYSAKPGKVKRKRINLSPVLQLIEHAENMPIYGDDPRNLNKLKIFSAAPVYSHEDQDGIKNRGKLQGYLYVIIGGEIYDTVFSRIKSNDTLLITASWLFAALIFLFIILLLLFKYFTNPINKLAKEISQIQAANFDLSKVQLSQWPKYQSNEVHLLGNSLNVIVRLIHQQINLLEQNDSQRRELLTHLSHDLRTPLASLQGYLEILNHQNTKLDEQQQQEYLTITLNNCKQLKHLIDQIFELAHLESGRVSVNNEMFNLGELIYDIVAKFTLKAQKANVKLTIKPTVCDFNTLCDIAKLERVLSNLIENALRHTPENGEIIINVFAKNSKLVIQVSDTGTGIKAEEINYIFDARYRASNAVGHKKQHGGLGLAISKRLLQILNSDIKVHSEFGKGTLFEFSIRQAA
ncbi:sensor histidine kinase [Pseudoalteromonas denitrificans]|jgi:signal transduction histidine kinase|uniref:histidine kinase n=1 Tax=Pseudoalteromonas denitrificans DSM 6059 TaxID=1123010 RepID=A0A1I1MC27_9GAMM|nr:ATP-binding protein [Pseudoalteromonas denitrificans]SFC82392.1 Signal transduction histidine kinase [Pseudoalteromonas denitrificans DSM 6059]